MTKTRLEKLAETDEQLARFIAKEKELMEEKAKTVGATRKTKKYAPNHLPITRNLSEAAAEAIDKCTLPS